MSNPSKILVVASLLALAAPVGPASGVQGPDSLQCYRISDTSLRGLKGIVDLDATTLGLAPGCKLGRAKQYCTPASASVQPATLKNGNEPLTELPYHGAPADGDRVCYQVKCTTPVGTAPSESVRDRFGAHDLRRLRTDSICVPAYRPGATSPPDDGFQIATPDIPVAPGQDINTCYYFRTPNDAKMAAARITSEMSPIVKRVIMVASTDVNGQPYERKALGTVSASGCTLLDVPRARWLYSADTAQGEMTLPPDDGDGNPVALEIPASTSGFLMIHARNDAATTQMAKVSINLEALESPVYTRTEAFIAYEDALSLAPGLADIVTRSCAAPAGARFWAFTTLTHGLALESNVLNGFEALLHVDGWEHPGLATFPSPPFKSFTGDTLTYSCFFANTTTFTVGTGPSYQSQEECAAVGYFFPATGPQLCTRGNPNY